MHPERCEVLACVSCHCSTMEPDGGLALSGSSAERDCPVVKLDEKYGVLLLLL